MHCLEGRVCTDALFYDLGWLVWCFLSRVSGIVESGRALILGQVTRRRPARVFFQYFSRREGGVAPEMGPLVEESTNNMLP